MSETITETCWHCKGCGILVFNNMLLGMKQPSGTPKSYLVPCGTCGGTGKTSRLQKKQRGDK